MRTFLLIALACLPVFATESPSVPLESCLNDLRAQRRGHLESLAGFAIPFDKELSRLLEVGRDQERSLVTILATKNPEANFPFLMANAVESCRTYQKVLEIRMRKFRAFVASAVVTLLAMLLYMICYGLPKFGRPPMDKPTAVAFLLFVLNGFSYGADGKLTVYTYDSLASKKSLGGVLVKEFKKQTGADVELVGFKSAGEALNQIVLEGKSTGADVLAGVDNTFLEKAKKSGLFEKLSPALAGFPLPKKLLFDPESQFLPFDYGYLAFIYDGARTKGLESVNSLEALSTHAALKKRIVIEDPRTSSIGQCFLAWTKEAFPSLSYLHFWKNMLGQIVTIPPGWSAAYGLFLKKEADVVLSYTTSPAYHEEMEKNGNYKFLLFKDGHYQQIEGVGVLKSSKNMELAKKFVSLLLSKKVQEQIPTLQWMYPADPGAKLPKSYRRLAQPLAVPTSAAAWESNREAWLREWTLLLSKGK